MAEWFLTRMQRLQNRERIVTSTSSVERTGYPDARNQLEPLPYSISNNLTQSRVKA
jgi:hypothetical protein